MATYLEMDFDQLVTDAIEDTIRTAAELRAETTTTTDEEDAAAYLELDTDELTHGEKADLPEKQRYDCSALRHFDCASMNQYGCPATKRYDCSALGHCDCDGRNHAVEPLDMSECESSCLEQPSAESTSESPRVVPENFLRLIASSEYVFNGFEELLEGSASLLGGIEKLISSSKESLYTFDSEENNENEVRSKHEEESSCSDESSGGLSPRISLTALQKASDIEKERIKQLQEQIQAMNESIRETDIFIKQCQKLNDDLTEECRKLDSCTNEAFSIDQTSELHLEITTITTHGTFAQAALPSLQEPVGEVGKYQTVDHTAPNYDRWSMLYGDQPDNPLNNSRLPFAGPMNLGEGEPHHMPFLSAPTYDELESIWESGEEEESAN